MKARLMLIGCIVFMAVLMTAFVVHAATINCGWQPVTLNADGTPCTDLAGYRLFQRTAGANYDYTAPIAEIPAGTEVCTLANIPDGDYRWVLRAFDLTGNESGDSNEISHLIDGAPGIPGFG